MGLRKYTNSTYKGVKITDVELHKDFDDSAVLVLKNLNDTLLVMPLWMWYDECKDFSMDYLLCDIQDTTDLVLQK